MNWNQLECFVSLAEHLSFTAAARQLHIAQPAVSRQIRLLEESLGTRLFIRDRQKVILSADGRRFFRQIEPHFREIQISAEALSSERSKLTGRIGISCLAEVGQALIFPFLSDFQRQHPEMRIDAEFGTEAQISAWVSQGETDFGITTRASLREGLRSYPLVVEKSALVTCGRNRNDLNLRDLKREKFIFYMENDPLVQRYLREHLPDVRMSELNVALTVNSHRSMIEALVRSDTYAVMPLFSVRKEVDRGILKIASPLLVSSPLYLTHLENPLMERRRKVFRDYLLKSLKALDV